MKNKKRPNGLDSKLPGIVLFEGDVARETRFLTQEEKGFYLDFVLAQSEFGPMTWEQILNAVPTGFERCSKGLERFVQKDGDRYYISWVEKARSIRDNTLLNQKYAGYLSGCKRTNSQPKTKEEFKIENERCWNGVGTAFEPLRVKVRVKDGDEDRVISGGEFVENNTKEIPPEIEKAINENSQQVLSESEFEEPPF